MARIDWRAVLSRAPLPMLALAASHGVYSYNLLFVPAWVALVSAAAFELTYCGLSVVRLTADQQPRARRIAASAVIVSVIYNTLAGLFHRRPGLLADLPLGLDVTLAILHGLPLAIVAYSVAHLLLHDAPRPTSAGEGGVAAASAPLPDMSHERPAADTALPNAKNALQPVVTGYIADQPYATAQDNTLGYDVPVAMGQHPDVLSEHTSIYDHTTSQPIATGSTLLSHRCPRCTSPISQAQYAAAVRRGASWRGCPQCRSPQQGHHPATLDDGLDYIEAQH
jgi:hypothetical protein